MSGIDRTEILRRDCPTCRGNGFVTKPTGEESCAPCNGSGMIEKEVPYKFDTNGRRTPEELADIWEVPVEDIAAIDKGHSVGD